MGPLYWEKNFALFMRLLRMSNIVLTIISVSTTHTMLYCAATATALYSTDRTNTVDRWIGITGTSTIDRGSGLKLILRISRGKRPPVHTE